MKEGQERRGIYVVVIAVCMNTAAGIMNTKTLPVNDCSYKLNKYYKEGKVCLRTNL